MAVIATGGPVNRDSLERGLRLLRSWELRPIVLPSTYRRRRYLAGEDHERLRDLTEAWTNPLYRAVLCARGGYGSIRLLDSFDYELPRRYPKIFLGYSDVTALHLALIRRSGLVVFHGPMVSMSASRAGNATTIEFMRRALMSSDPLGALPASSAPVVAVTSGRATGVLYGGNLTTLCSCIGTEEMTVPEGSLFFFEDVGEPLYKVDRLLTQILRTGGFDRSVGLVVGEFVRTAEQPVRPPDGPMLELLSDRLGRLGIPIAYGVSIGHGFDQWTLPIGVTASLDASAGTLAVIEPATIS